MATEGTPKEGLDYIGAKAYTSALSLVAYTNTANSLDDDTVYADLTQPTSANGYAPIALSGSWSFTDGTVEYTHGGGGNPTWTATGTWSNTVKGVAIVDTTAGEILHFKDLPSAFTAANLKKLEVDLATLISP